jgi:hypothetical protein
MWIDYRITAWRHSRGYSTVRHRVSPSWRFSLDQIDLYEDIVHSFSQMNIHVVGIGPLSASAFSGSVNSSR